MLEYEVKNIAITKPDEVKKAFDFCEEYKQFITKAKTERECVAYIIERAKKEGYKEFEKNKSSLNAGEKYFVNFRSKAAILFTVGKETIDKGISFSIAHIDSPRLDLKPNPLYENSEIAYFKTHYYGGIRKYQWVTIPLSMHGVVYLQDGKSITLNIGEKDDEPKFLISDLLPHLSKKQDKRTLDEGISGEELNIIVGSLPFLTKEEDKKIKNKVKEKTLEILKQKYNITEKDFLRAEIEMVPAYKACDIGFDCSMIGGYGQDDRVCAYPALIAEIDCVSPKYWTMTVFTDKEEIGSYGNTGLDSNFLFDVVEDLADMQNVKVREVYRNSLCFSSDVNAAFDPTFPDVFEKRNSAHFNHGVTLCKYTGARGKACASDASCETVAKVIDILDKNNVTYQFAELGKVDEGGGGTIAHYIAKKCVETIDIGVSVLSMHSPFELTSKLDIYNTYLSYKSLLER